ncbi:MAG TPA: ATPase [Rhodospirillaceae bacterium]|nr:ATPase [Rhodospirillaceae bacterium]
MTKHKTKTTPVYDVVADGDGFALHRDGRFLMTPAGLAFRVPTLDLANQIAEEWRAQGEKILPATMPMTQLAATAFDIVAKDRAKIVRGLTGYATSELLCHFAQEPEALTEKQRVAWQPYLDWCAQRYNAHFVTGCGVMPIRQNPDTVPTLTAVIDAFDDFSLAGLSSATDSTGSLVLGLALAEGFTTAQDIFHASVLDTLHQAIRWGDDPVTIARHTSIQKDLEACEKWFALLRQDAATTDTV